MLIKVNKQKIETLLAEMFSIFSLLSFNALTPPTIRCMSPSATNMQNQARRGQTLSEVDFYLDIGLPRENIVLSRNQF